MLGICGDGVPGYWLHHMSKYMSTYCKAGGVALEIGGTAERLHIKTVLRVRSEQPDAYRK